MLAAILSSAQAASLLQATNVNVDPQRCMGTWYVQRAIPALAALENGAHNGCEEYVWDAAE